MGQRRGKPHERSARSREAAKRHVDLAARQWLTGMYRVAGRRRPSNLYPVRRTHHVSRAPFPELRLDGLPNAAGVSLVELRDPDTSQMYELGNSVEDLTASDGSTLVAQGDELVGWELVLEKDSEQVIAAAARASLATLGATMP